MYRKRIVGILIALILIPTIPETASVRSESPDTSLGKIPLSDTSHENLTMTTTHIMDGEVEIWSSGQEFDGYNLFVLRKRKFDTVGYNQTLFLTDMQGNILIEENVVDGSFELADVNVEMINSTTLLMGYENTAALWNLATGKKLALGFWGHHEYEYNNNDNTIFTFEYHPVNIDGQYYLFDLLNEYDLNRNVVWSLDTSDFISPSWWCPFHDRFANLPDITHSNAIFYDDDTDMIYYNARNLNTFYKIDHKTGEVIWALGEHGDFTLIDRYGRVRDNLFYHGHALEKVDDNTFIIFDNDLHNQTNQFNHQSRMIEITIDEETMTARETWTWTGDDTYWCHYWGDADRLPNGDRLGTFGATSHAAGNYGARVVEVNEAGHIVWEMNFVASESYKWGIYRCERIRFKPTLISPTDSLALFNEDIELTWQGLYNFRSKMSMLGSYWAYVNGNLVSTGNITYDRFWRPVDVLVSIGQLAPGYYNITLMVSDEGNHTTSDSIWFTIVPVYIARLRSTYLVEGSSEDTIKWIGGTIHPLDCQIFVDSVETMSFVWTGDDIELNLDVFSVGEHQVQLNLINDSEIIYTDSFTLKICPNLNPVITKSPGIKSFSYGREKPLIWIVNECAPSFWELYANNILKLNSTWTANDSSITWTPDNLPVGAYNITLVVVDMAGHHVADTVVLFITTPTPPIITSIPYVVPLQWGASNVTFSWGVIGGSYWIVSMNKIPVYGGPVTDTTIGFTIDDWSKELWAVGVNELTLKVFDAFGSASDTLRVTVIQDPGDAYIDEVVTSRSAWYSEGVNAIGVPDGVTASIFQDYGYGYMTLDFGLNEEVIDGSGDDFEIFASGDNYSLYVSESLSSSLILIGVFSGNQRIDINSLGITSVRYVRIELYSGESIHLDAIEAINYNSPPSDKVAPMISDESDVVMYPFLSSMTLHWSGSDDNPLSYHVIQNGTIVEFGAWTGGDVDYTFTPKRVGSWNVTMVFSDAFGNTISDTVFVKVTTIHSNPSDITGLLIMGGVGISLLIIVLFVAYRRKSLT